MHGIKGRRAAQSSHSFVEAFPIAVEAVPMMKQAVPMTNDPVPMMNEVVPMTNDHVPMTIDAFCGRLERAQGPGLRVFRTSSL
jgi:hypothetical protein